MKLVTYRLADFEGSETIALGALRHDQVVRLDVSTRHDHHGLGSVEEYLSGLPGTQQRAKSIAGDSSDPGVPLAEVHLYPPIAHPKTVLVCRPTDDGIVTEPVKHPVITGHGDAIPASGRGTVRFGLRPQLGLVTPREMRLPLEHIEPAAYVLFNEVHIHDLESGEDSAVIGLGPFLVTPDEIPNPRALDVRVTFDRRDAWHGTTAYLHSPAEILFELQRKFQFEPGTLIGMGPLPGSFGVDGAEWLEPGETFTVAIDGLGELTQHLGSR